LLGWTAKRHSQKSLASAPLALRGEFSKRLKADERPDDYTDERGLVSRKKYKFKRRPYLHQLTAIKRGLEQLKKTGGFALLMEPRTGKTKVSVDISSIMHEAGHVNRVLVLCPLAVMDVWEDEIEANCPERYRITMWDKKGRKKTNLPPWGSNRLDFVIMNHEAFSTPARRIKAGTYVNAAGEKVQRWKRSRTRGGKLDVLRMLVRWQPQLIIVDESHRYKQPNVAKVRMLMRKALRDIVPYWIIQTGTLQTKKNRVVDVYVQYKIMNPKSPLVANMSAGDFKSEYSVETRRNGYPQFLRVRNPNRMRRLIHDEAFAITRKEAFGEGVRLPNQIIPIELTGHNRELYEQMALDMIARIKTGEITEASIKLVQGLRLQQLTSGIAKTTPTETHPDSRTLRVGRDKLLVLEDLCKDWFEAGEHVIIPGRFKPDHSGIRALMRKLKVPTFEITGAVKGREERARQWRDFNKANGPACFIGQPQAMSLGIDLRSAAIMVWFSLTRSWVDFSQTEDRNALNDDPRSYVYLLAKGTYDYIIYQSLQEDEDVGKLVMKDPGKLWVPPT
jgi:hypothetical protein